MVLTTLRELGEPQTELGMLCRESVGRVSETLGGFLKMLGGPKRQLGPFCGLMEWTDLGSKR